MSGQGFNPSRGWVRVLGELAIIFTGVTLGLLADDWRQNRDDAKAERVALQGLSQDLLRDSMQLQQARAVAGGWDAAALWARRTGPGDVTAQEAAERIRGALGLTLYQPIAASYSSLKESGQLELIGDPDLRRRVVEYFEESQSTMSSMHALTQDRFFQFQSDLWPYFTNSVSDSTTSLFPSEGTRARASWSAFWEDDGARQSLEELGRAGAIWAFLIPGVLEANSDLRGRIAESLRR